MHSQERELEEKRRAMEKHLTKMDRLESDYQQKCHAAQCVQQDLEKAQDELRTSNEIAVFKDQRIQDLESKFETRKLEITDSEVANVAVQVNVIPWLLQSTEA